MLNFSKLKVLSIYLITSFLIILASFNFLSSDNELLNKKINLGLDLQGGSYLLLEVDTKPLIKERIQNKVIDIKKFLRQEKINFKSFKIENNLVSFEVNNDEKDINNIFFSKKTSNFNPYIDNYRTYELDLNKKDKIYEISFSKYGLLTLNNSAVKQSIEIVRRRIDDLGTKEPTIVQRGEKRIVVELPGLKDPSRIKSLLGKTAKLTFRLVSNSSTRLSNSLNVTSFNLLTF